MSNQSVSRTLNKIKRGRCAAAALAVMLSSPAWADAGRYEHSISRTDNDSQYKQSMKDAWLDGKAESVLLFSMDLNNFAIDTEVENGTVTLSGKVDNEVEKDLAEELVLSLDGVQDVVNNLTIANERELSDEMKAGLVDAKIASMVKAKLLMNDQISGTDIDVEANEGVVVLSGKVTSSAEKKLIEKIAENTDDVEDVVNKIDVS